MAATRTSAGVASRDAAVDAYRLDLEPGTEHAATVGPSGVESAEASR